jgi:hypothetical protein
MIRQIYGKQEQDYDTRGDLLASRCDKPLLVVEFSQSWTLALEFAVPRGTPLNWPGPEGVHSGRKISGEQRWSPHSAGRCSGGGS